MKKRWTPADRDELGEMRPSFNPGLLVSQGGARTKSFWKTSRLFFDLKDFS
jgi:hypothetical protein